MCDKLRRKSIVDHLSHNLATYVLVPDICFADLKECLRIICDLIPDVWLCYNCTLVFCNCPQHTCLHINHCEGLDRRDQLITTLVYVSDLELAREGINDMGTCVVLVFD